MNNFLDNLLVVKLLKELDIFNKFNLVFFFGDLLCIS